MSLLSLVLLAIPLLIFFGLYRRFGNPFDPKNMDWKVTISLITITVGIVLFAFFVQPINQPEWLASLLEAYKLFSSVQSLL